MRRGEENHGRDGIDFGTTLKEIYARRNLGEPRKTPGSIQVLPIDVDLGEGKEGGGTVGDARVVMTKSLDICLVYAFSVVRMFGFANGVSTRILVQTHNEESQLLTDI